MSKSLPTRPNLDHLREQAKDLLAAFREGHSEAVATLHQNVPALNLHPVEEIVNHEVTLADAQSAVARQHGFPSWAQLVRHVESMRAIDGTWVFTSLEVEGTAVPQGSFRNSSLTIDGNAFAMVSPEANYAGTCDIDVSIVPHTIDIHFTEGPEAGNSSLGIYEFDGRELKICLGFTDVPRPKEFATKAGGGTALETLRRGQPAESVADARPSQATMPTPEMLNGFGEMTPALEAIQGEWDPLSIVKDGMTLPSMFYKSGKRVMLGAESTVSFGGQIYMQALTRIDPKPNSN